MVMAEAVGIDKEKPKEAVTVAVKMLKGEGGGVGREEKGVALSRMFLLCELYHGAGSKST